MRNFVYFWSIKRQAKTNPAPKRVNSTRGQPMSCWKKIDHGISTIDYYHTLNQGAATQLRCHWTRGHVRMMATITASVSRSKWYDTASAAAMVTPSFSQARILGQRPLVLDFCQTCSGTASLHLEDFLRLIKNHCNLAPKATGFKFEQYIQVQGLFTEACLNTLASVAVYNTQLRCATVTNNERRLPLNCQWRNGEQRSDCLEFPSYSTCHSPIMADKWVHLRCTWSSTVLEPLSIIAAIL